MTKNRDTAALPLGDEQTPIAPKTKQVAMRIEQAPAQPVSESMAMLNMIERAASDPNVNLDKMERLLKMRDDYAAREAEHSFNDAMAEAQKGMAPVRADASNPQTKSKYASYAALDRALRPVYTQHGFALSFNTEEGAPADHIRVVCYVTAHKHTRKYHLDMAADGKGAKGGDVMTKTHATGSAATYGQRYLLKMIFNIAVDQDDDGNRAGKGEIPQGLVKDPIDGEPLIALDKADWLRERCSEVKCPVPKFLKWLGVEKVEDLPSRYFDAAVHGLDEYKRTADAKVNK